jgi:DNA polymerase-3 subunit epsilon
MRNLRLGRPLVCFDLETTGTDVARDRIVQIALIRVEPDGSRRTYETLVNPQIPIPSGATAVHGIGDKDVADKPALAAIADDVTGMLDGADLLGFNSIQFDLPLLAEEMRRVGRPLEMVGRRHLDAMRIFHEKEKRDLTAAFRFYCGGELVGAHSALADAKATLDVLEAQLERYGDLPRTPDGLHQFCHRDQANWIDISGKFIWNADGEASFGFGKNKGRTLKDVFQKDPGYFDWMLGSDFTGDVKRIAAEAKLGLFPRKPG